MLDATGARRSSTTSPSPSTRARSSGIAGVEGNGQTELIDALIGLKHADSGSIGFLGEDITSLAHPQAPRGRRRLHPRGPPPPRPAPGVPALGEPHPRPRHREAQREGLLARHQGRPDDTRRIVEEYDVRTPGIDVTAASLSGGNQQKLIVGREMSHKPRFLIAAHPTRGVDVGAQAAIWDQIREARREGLAVLLISADLDELIGLSDTLRVIYNGRLVADADPATITPEELGSAMTGAASGHLEHAESAADLGEDETR